MPGRILLIDAVSASRIVLRFRLSTSCYEVFTAASAKEAVETGKSCKPDLIVISRNTGDGGTEGLIERFSRLPATRNAPILVLTAAESAQQRIALLKAGAEDVIERTADDDLLMARLRVLMRRRATAEEVIQRDSTQRQLAMCEPVQTFHRPGLVALVAPDAHRAQAWLEVLSPLTEDNLTVITMEAALAACPRGPAPDVFVVACSTAARDPGLRLLSELRSRTETRHSATVALVEGEQSNQDLVRDRAAMALDVGAADVLVNGFNQVELALRIKRQMAFKKQADQLRNSVRAGLQMAVCDPLTGLFNRRYAMPHLARIAAAASDRGRPFATMLLDLDRFKTVNDTYGHKAGDEVLVAVAERLKDNLRSHDLLARIGGEEFLVAMPDTGHKNAREAADRLRDIVRKTPIDVPGLERGISVTCSIGVSVTQPRKSAVLTPVPDVAGLIDVADSALYQSKADGRDMVTFARPAA